ncbi:WXG100 family type VII secretion target [Nocardia kruczakiae]|uniref:WXG100 family type VII secretion target n=1 Tax=Nocardia kruczakiae TaxID=261477 RepID=A0ABU1XMH5_9NOCA|nr:MULTISPECIES: WXG100 family type VII secretion target [Nocardia]MDR7171122.1 WXG100 family type VII secretion target [Nocardia kruczakiae]
MAQSFNLDGGKLDDFIRQMNDLHTTIDGHVQTARATAGELAHHLQGGAGDALQATFERFLDAAKRMNDSLLQNADNLQDVNKKYGHVEMDQLHHLKEVDSLLNM